MDMIAFLTVGFLGMIFLALSLSGLQSENLK